MTFWARLMVEYPDMGHMNPANKMVKCRCSWGYEKKERGLCMTMPSCEACWKREQPEGNTRK